MPRPTSENGPAKQAPENPTLPEKTTSFTALPEGGIRQNAGTRSCFIPVSPDMITVAKQTLISGKINTAFLSQAIGGFPGTLPGGIHHLRLAGMLIEMGIS